MNRSPEKKSKNHYIRVDLRTFVIVGGQALNQLRTRFMGEGDVSVARMKNEKQDSLCNEYHVLFLRMSSIC